ncbi:hypothetical protein [uncultured Oceanisphaera sp.]|uniref:hypothetical protein n=1 Tax=uncultured Oceanisphaera sp. TaxID=353858 RepID=UPI002614AB38|nr:hypothetical protein [uncultured Oceanisphaera sp.]
MTTAFEQLAELDRDLLIALAHSEQLDEHWLSEQLDERATLLQAVIKQADVTPQQSSELIARSRKLKEAAEQLQQRLGEQLKKMQKGRRSMQAYQSVKRN